MLPAADADHVVVGVVRPVIVGEGALPATAPPVHHGCVVRSHHARVAHARRVTADHVLRELVNVFLETGKEAP